MLICQTRTLPATQVTDPSGAAVSESKGQHQGQFAFTTKTAGEYQACFSTVGEF
jgi:hypothetical protein